MNKQDKLDAMYMQIAVEHSKLSHAVRAKAGAVIVTPDQVMLGGYNGTPSGYPNECEDKIDGKLVSKPTVIHAEENALLKAAREGVSTKGSTLYVTLEPCRKCSAMLKSAGILRVVYLDKYVSQTSGCGTAELEKFITVEQLKKKKQEDTAKVGSKVRIITKGGIHGHFLEIGQSVIISDINCNYYDEDTDKKSTVYIVKPDLEKTYRQVLDRSDFEVI